MNKKMVAQELLKVAKSLSAERLSVVYDMWSDKMGSLESHISFGSMKTVPRHDIDAATFKAVAQLEKNIKVIEEVAKQASLEVEGKRFDVHSYTVNIIGGELVVVISTVLGFKQLGPALNTRGKEMSLEEAVKTVMKNARIPVEKGM